MPKLLSVFFEIEESMSLGFSGSERMLIRMLFLLTGSKGFFHGSRLEKDEGRMDLFQGELMVDGSEG